MLFFWFGNKLFNHRKLSVVEKLMTIIDYVYRSLASSISILFRENIHCIIGKTIFKYVILIYALWQLFLLILIHIHITFYFLISISLYWEYIF